MSGQAQGRQGREAARQTTEGLPPGAKLLHTLQGHEAPIRRIAWSPDGRILASPSSDGTIRLWDAQTGECLRVLQGRTSYRLTCAAWSPDSLRVAWCGGGPFVAIWDMAESWAPIELLHPKNVQAVAWSPTGEILASGCNDGAVRLWDNASGELIRQLRGPTRSIVSVAWRHDGRLLAWGTNGAGVFLWDKTTNKAPKRFSADDYVPSVVFAPRGSLLAFSDRAGAIAVCNSDNGRVLRRLEGNTGAVQGLAFSPDGAQLAAISSWNTVIWDTRTWQELAEVPGAGGRTQGHGGIAFHPQLPVLAVVGPASGPEASTAIHLWELDYATLLRKVVEPSVHYVNAKVILVGDTGVGKTGLSLVLNNQPYAPTDSTPGRRVWTFDLREVPAADRDVIETRETLLWDLAGQPGYRVIHQLHLNEVAVALVVFDARSETDPLSGVRHWERALRLAQQRQGDSAVPTKRLLVSARNDRGGVSIGEERLQAVLREFGFDGYYKTSAKEGWGIKELREAIEHAIPWERLPVVSSSQMFADIKTFLLEVKKTGRLLAPTGQLRDEFVRQRPDIAGKMTDLHDQFDTCIGRLENRDLIRRLTFGEYILLQPELLDAYGSAMVNAAKEDPDGLGSLAEEIALGGTFFVPEEQKVIDPGQEQLLLHATVEELVLHDLALRENADDGRYLVFPSQFNRDYEDAPEPKGKAVAITFDGPVQSLYSTLAVRLGHSGLFTTGRAEMWRNAAVFTARTGGKCGLFLHEFAEARGRLILFFPDERASAETRYNFEEFVLAHTLRRALDDTVRLVRFFLCPECGTPVPEAYVDMLCAQGQDTFHCFCPGRGVVSLAEPKERIHFQSVVEAMEQSADRQRDFDAFVVSAKGETSTRPFQDWAGGERVTLALVFTDVVGSTALGELVGDEAMNEVRRAHFAKGRHLIERFQGREIKTIGDSFLAAFRCADAALDYVRALQEDTGHPRVRIRVGIHIGPMHVEEGDVFGGTVNFAARVVGAIEDAEVWLSDRAKDDIDRLGAARYKELKWVRHEGVAMKGFPGKFTLWAVHS